MPLTTFLLGATTGTAVSLYSNGIRRLPLLREPHYHVLWALIGGFGALKLSTWTEQQRQEIDDLHRKLGRTPLPK